MASSTPNIVLAFDVYGTLLSTESIATQLATHFGESVAKAVATEWRKYQLEYTWRLNSMKKYISFSAVTEKSLHHALKEASLSLSKQDSAALLASYNTLSLFPDVAPLFPLLTNTPSISPCLFSNGTTSMISASLAQSPSLSPHAHLFSKIVVVEPVQKFKPEPDVYRHLCKEMGKQGREEEVWVVSGNPFDIVGAKAVGLRTCWVDRGGLGWVDSLAEEGEGPDVVVQGVGDVVGKVQDFVQNR